MISRIQAPEASGKSWLPVRLHPGQDAEPSGRTEAWVPPLCPLGPSWHLVKFNSQTLWDLRLWAPTAGPAVWNPQVGGSLEWGGAIFSQRSPLSLVMGTQPSPVLSPAGLPHSPGLWAFVPFCRAVDCQAGTLKLRAHRPGPTVIFHRGVL